MLLTACSTPEQTEPDKQPTEKHAMFVAGDIQYPERTVGGSPVRVALLGEHGPAVGEATNRLVDIIGAQRDFWGESEAPPYLVALFAPKGCCWSTATTKYHSLAGLIAQKTPDEALSSLASLVAHEHLHRWIPSQMGSPRPFNAYAWFVEGFTEFYARRFLVQIGAISPSTYVDQMNQLLDKYRNNPMRNAGRSRVNEDFRNNPDITQRAYQRGELLALNWNAAIREATDGEHSLDDVMRKLADKHAADDEFRFSDETFAETVHAVAPEVEVTHVINDHIDERTPVRPASNALGPCAKKTSPTTFEAVEDVDDNQKCREWLSPK
ncbi:MAG: hypothetical protein ABEN55_22965 [Bradymonadaceae bacterium]